ncbi:hypothetical protein DYU05_09530 [Mucilaginibacter terrenus]|uniref:Outer membrane protein beta-barrel domain-containing protein n=1 Tax=Mucilaginibacter terrenus TaxID=2482727 RepID=A0A3E2NXT7_9SPHI|nr:hypothetical protein [Mucilaginibacter terrenus]RFZ85813.1 hypothetical protein DYU05_09530 [Mucilaginibacter terrenus]
MIKLFTKTIFFTFLLTAITFMAKAQIGYDYAQYDFGLGANINRVYGDAETIKNTPSVSISFNYNHTPYLNYIVEVQAGKLEGGSDTSKSGRYFKNRYTALVFRAQLQAGELIDYSRSGLMNGLKNLYVSAGLGYMINDITQINRESVITPGFFTGGEDKAKELFIPIRVGYELKFFNKYDQPSFKIDFAMQYNSSFGDNMDGFTAGKSKDKLVQYSIGLKFAIGGVTSYSKQIHY